MWMMLAIVGSPAGDLSQAWAGGVGPSCCQAALEACQGLCLLSTVLSCPAAFLRTVRPDLNVMQSRAIFFQKAIVLASCHHLCPARSPPVGLHPYPFLSAGHGCQLPINLSVLPRRGCRLGGKGTTLGVEGSGFEF